MKDSSDCHSACNAVVDRNPLPSCEESLGEAIMELLRAKKTISKYTLCLALIARIDASNDPQQEAHLYQVLGLIFRAQKF